MNNRLVLQQAFRCKIRRRMSHDIVAAEIFFLGLEYFYLVLRIWLRDFASKPVVTIIKFWWSAIVLIVYFAILLRCSHEVSILRLARNWPFVFFLSRLSPGSKCLIENFNSRFTPLICYTYSRRTFHDEDWGPRLRWLHPGQRFGWLNSLFETVVLPKRHSTIILKITSGIFENCLSRTISLFNLLPAFHLFLKSFWSLFLLLYSSPILFP